MSEERRITSIRQEEEVSKESIAKAAREAIQVVALAAEQALKVRDAQSATAGNDHDLIVGLGVGIEYLRADVKEIKNGFAVKIEDLYKCNADLVTDLTNIKIEFANMKGKAIAYGSIAGIVVSIIIGVLIKRIGG